MKKLNKKGFTLIEMLVVIAIIAILVAIIVPTVSSSTEKAAAATNAANLRSVAAEISIAMLNEDAEYTGTTEVGAPCEIDVGTTKIAVPAPRAVKSLNVTKDSKFAAKLENGAIVCTYGGITVEEFSAKAGNSGSGSASSGS